MNNKKYVLEYMTDLESFAIWNIPNISETEIIELEQFEDKYQMMVTNKIKSLHMVNSFPNLESFKNEFQKNMKKSVSTGFVLVGMNPGNAHIENSKQEFKAFHGDLKSCDYRLASALFKTKMYGSLMTDLSSIVESDSAKVDITTDSFENLINRLEKIGVNMTEMVVVCMGNKSYESGKNSIQLNPSLMNRIKGIETIPHYSCANGHWQTLETRTKVKDIINKYD